MKLAFLGLGKMGSAMARHLATAGHQVTVWNRSAGKAEAMKACGCQPAATAAEAVRGAEVVLTMLFDDAAYEYLFFTGQAGAEPLAKVLQPGQLHLAMGTISVALSERLAREHGARGVGYVGAPVFGRPSVAEAGKLWVVAAGEQAELDRARLVTSAFARGFSAVGQQPWQAHAVKLGGNFLISSMIHGLSEAFVFAEGQGIEPGAFFEAINSALFQSPFYALYANVMLNPPETPGATVALGAKDLRLLAEAAQAGGTRMSLAETMSSVFREAIDLGMEGEDWAAGQYQMAKLRGRKSQE